MTTIIQYWHSEETPDEIAAAIATFRKHNPSMRHLVFNETTAERFIAERFTPREVAAFRACGVPAMQADYLRYCAVLYYGGIYADADMHCVAPLSSLLGSDEEGIVFGWQNLPPRWRTPQFEGRERVGRYRVVLNAFFAFRAARHPLLELTLAGATANIENRIAGDVGTMTGPALFTSLYLLRELGSIDAFLEYADGTAIERSAPLLCDAIGDYREVERAFGGIRIPLAKEGDAWARQIQPLPAYKKTQHWTNVHSSIYR